MGRYVQHKAFQILKLTRLCLTNLRILQSMMKFFMQARFLSGRIQLL